MFYLSIVLKNGVLHTEVKDRNCFVIKEHVYISDKIVAILKMSPKPEGKISISFLLTTLDLF